MRWHNILNISSKRGVRRNICNHKRQTHCNKTFKNCVSFKPKINNHHFKYVNSCVDAFNIHRGLPPNMSQYYSKCWKKTQTRNIKKNIKKWISLQIDTLFKLIIWTKMNKLGQKLHRPKQTTLVHMLNI